MVPERWSLPRGMCTRISCFLASCRSKNHLRSNSGNSDTIDLHGTTIAEAVVIVKEILDREASSISQGKASVFPLSGQHSGLSLIFFLLPLLRLLTDFAYLFGLVLCCHHAGTSSFLCYDYPHKPKAKPLKIITGRGTHSLNKVGVLKPAVRKALVEDGWVVSSWDGGLVVQPRGI